LPPIPTTDFGPGGVLVGSCEVNLFDFVDISNCFSLFQSNRALRSTWAFGRLSLQHSHRSTCTKHRRWACTFRDRDNWRRKDERVCRGLHVFEYPSNVAFCRMRRCHGCYGYCSAPVAKSSIITKYRHSGPETGNILC
jgi:hypothetical protein